MFQKPFKIKSSSQMRNSDKKSLKTKLSISFGNLTETEIDFIVSNKEPIHVMKICTHSNNIVTLYLVNKLPISFEYNDVMYPTVFMLWQVPELLPCFTTYEAVFPKLAAGADLMLPGLVLPNIEGPSKYQRLQKGDIVAINFATNKIPVAIGLTAHSSFDMYMAAGRGKCVNILHSYGDKLCTMDGCPVLQLPALGPPNWLINEEDSQKNSLEENFMEPSTVENEPNMNSEVNTVVENLTDISLNSTEEMDKLLRYCFLKTVKYSKKKLVLPILTSNFYRTFMIVSCPRNVTLDIKLSSYKKLNKFLNKMVELQHKNPDVYLVIYQEGIITIQEQPKGVEKITVINFDHPSVLSFITDENDILEHRKLNDDKDIGPNVSEMFTVSAAVLPLFREEYLRKGDTLSSGDVRKYVTNYVKNNNLLSTEDSRMILPNQELSKLLKSTAPISWEDLMHHVYEAMGVKFKVAYEGSEITGKGKIEPITISVATRTWNKKVTMVDNLELFGIKIGAFGKECQHGVAASTSVTRPPGKKCDQLLVQGNQVLFIGNLLQNKYKIPKKYIRGLELAPKNKK